MATTMPVQEIEPRVGSGPIFRSGPPFVRVRYILPLIGQWLLSMKTSLSRLNFDNDKIKSHPIQAIILN